jgi:hypothetical protein
VGSLLGFKHSVASIELMIEKHKERNKLVSPETKLERVTSRLNGEYTIVINSISGENLVFVSVRKAAYFIGWQALIKVI